MARANGSGLGGSRLRTSGQIKADKAAEKSAKAAAKADKAAAKNTNPSSSSNVLTLPSSNVFSIGGNKGSLSQYQLPNGIVSVDSIIPPQAQAILEAQFKSLGLPFDISGLAIKAGADNRQALKQMEETVEMLFRNAELLPRWVATIKKALKVATKSAKAQAEIVKASLKEQHQIDEAHADMLLALMGYNKKHNTIALKLQRKAQQQEAIMNAQARYYETTWGKEAQLIDAQYQFLTDVALQKTETKQLKAQTNKEKALDRENWMKESL